MMMSAPRSASFVALLPLMFAGRPTRVPAEPASTAVAQVGRIAGKVEVSSALATRRPRFRIYADAGPGAVPPAHVKDDISRELRNVVVYIGSDAANPLSANDSSPSAETSLTAVMSQTNERFEPHVLPVVQGARVAFPNRDDVYHNVFSLSSARTFDLGRYPKGDAKTVTFTKAGVVQVFCHIHSDMNGVVLVLSNSFYAAPDSSGRYSLENVPVGEYTVVGWHERTKPVARRVRVVSGETTTINFSLPLGPRSEP